MEWFLEERAKLEALLAKFPPGLTVKDEATRAQFVEFALALVLLQEQVASMRKQLEERQ